MSEDLKQEEARLLAELATQKGPQIAESKQAKAIRFVVERPVALFDVEGGLALDTRSGSVRIGSELLEIGHAVTTARANLGKIPDALIQMRGEITVVEITREDMRDAIVHVARRNSYDPVRSYLESLPSWDGIDRSQGLLDSLHVEEPKPLHRSMLRRTLIAAVARVFEPGCKVDTICVLHAPEGGEGKSTFWRMLFGGDEFFSDSRIDLENKDGMQSVDRYWVHEWAEMAALKSNATGETIKAFLSSQRDDYRAPYAATVTSHPRRSLFVGTTNDSVVLRDNGGNRRFWIIPDVGEINLAWVDQNQAQILAQAIAEYRRGEQRWLTRDEQAENAIDQREHTHETPGTGLVENYVVGKTEIRSKDILTMHGLGVFCGPGLASHKGAEMKIGAILKKLGWRRVRAQGERIYTRTAASSVTTSGTEVGKVGTKTRGQGVFGISKF